MRSNRLAILAVLAGSGLLGFTSAGVVAIASNAAPGVRPTLGPRHGHGDHDADRGERGL